MHHAFQYISLTYPLTDKEVKPNVLIYEGCNIQQQNLIDPG